MHLPRHRIASDSCIITHYYAGYDWGVREDLADSHANAPPFHTEMGAQTAVISESGVKHVWHLAISKPVIVEGLSSSSFFFCSLCSVSGETFPRFLLSSYIPVAGKHKCTQSGREWRRTLMNERAPALMGRCEGGRTQRPLHWLDI